MLRFYQDFSGRLLLLLLYIRDRWGEDVLREGERYSFEARFRDGQVAETIAHLEPESEYKTVSNLVDPLVEQLRAQQTHTANDKDLIDTFVRILQLTFLKNRLISADFLKRLRSAILLPSELLGLKEKLRKGELYCFQCRKALLSGEMASVIHDRNSDPYLICTHCFYPTYIACPKGKHSIRSPKGLEKMLSNLKKEPCELCELEKLNAGVGGTGEGAEIVRGLTGRLEPVFIGETAVIPPATTERAEDLLRAYRGRIGAQAANGPTPGGIQGAGGEIRFTPAPPQIIQTPWADNANNWVENHFFATAATTAAPATAEYLDPEPDIDPDMDEGEDFEDEQ